MHLYGTHYFLFSEGMSRHTTWEPTDDDRTPTSLPASIKEIQKEEHSGKAHGEAEALGQDHDPIRKIY